ncbi:MAG: hypothetical protein U0V70_20070 [Terriglobia bacterium]
METGQVDWDYCKQEALFVAKYLEASDNHLAIVQGLSTPPGREIRKPIAPYKYFAYERVYPRGPDVPKDVITDVHYFLTAPYSDPEIVKKLLKMEARNRLMAVLTSAPDGFSLDEYGQTVDDRILEQLAMKADHILVGAYDGDVILIWSRN